MKRYRRRTFAEVAAAARVVEREQIAQFGRWHIAAVTNMIATGKVDAESGSLLTARIESFLEQIEQGLHVAAEGGNG